MFQCTLNVLMQLNTVNNAKNMQDFKIILHF